MPLQPPKDPQNRNSTQGREPSMSQPVRRYPIPQSSAVKQEPRYTQDERSSEGIRRYPKSQTNSPRNSTSNRRSEGAPRPTNERKNPASRTRPTQHKANNKPHEEPPSEAVVFFKVLFKLLLLIIFICVFVYVAFRLLVPFVPYSFEEKISHNIVKMMGSTDDEKYVHARNELQTLAENLATHMNAPPDMPLRIHISPDRDMNAFATLGGHIFINQGTINAVTSENALAMVLAHEIAHVKNRDPLTGLGTSTLLTLAMTVVTGSDSGFTMVSNLAGLSFSRQQESNADRDALIALRSYYGHALGADEFFSKILRQDRGGSSPVFLNSHPDTANRIHLIKQAQVEVQTYGTLTPLSSRIRNIQNKK